LPADHAEQAYRTLRRAFRNVFASPEGQLVVAELRRFCRADKTTHAENDPGGRNSASQEGRRQVALYVEAMRSESDVLLEAFLEIPKGNSDAR
jgi:hypothetical protein